MTNILSIIVYIKKILPEYTKMSNQLEKLNQQYKVIYSDYQFLDKSREAAQKQYQEEMKKNIIPIRNYIID